MSARLIVLLVVIGLFGILTAFALAEVGYVGLFTLALQSWGGTQVLFDLVIVAALGCLWMIEDGRLRGINPWPFVIATLLTRGVRHPRLSRRPRAARVRVTVAPR